jgi:DNA polymerase
MPIQPELKAVLDEVRRHLEWQTGDGTRVVLAAPRRPAAVAAPGRRNRSQSRPPLSGLRAEAVSGSPVGLIQKESRSLEQIREELGDCRRCKLCSGRTNIVFGVGNPKAELVFVGEGPGADEDAQGIPFVGKAGQLLTKMIEAMGLQRADVYICNVVKCRPPNNRNPEPDEVQACEPFLRAQLGSIGPKVIVTLGKVAVQALLNDSTPITRLRGNWREYCGIKLMPTYHPAYLLRNPAEKRNAWSDLQKVMAFFEKSSRLSGD